MSCAHPTQLMPGLLRLVNKAATPFCQTLPLFADTVERGSAVRTVLLQLLCDGDAICSAFQAALATATAAPGFATLEAARGGAAVDVVGTVVPERRLRAVAAELDEGLIVGAGSALERILQVRDCSCQRKSTAATMPAVSFDRCAFVGVCNTVVVYLLVPCTCSSELLEHMCVLSHQWSGCRAASTCCIRCAFRSPQSWRPAAP